MEKETQRAYDLIVRMSESLSIYNLIPHAGDDSEYAHVVATLISDVERFHNRGEA